MEFSRDQKLALMDAARWFKAGVTQTFRLEGAAGTGKSSIANFFASKVPGLVVFVTPTGKAAQVLMRKGNKEVSTIHRAIYMKSDEIDAEIKKLRKELETTYTSQRKDAIDQEIKYLKTQLSFTLRNKESAFDGREPRLIILDESSMVSDEIMADLKSFHYPILCLGDPYQLQPVGGRATWNSGQPDATLHEIHRGSERDDIIALSVLMRQGREAPRWNGTAGLSTRDWSPLHLLEYEQIICGMNKTRWQITETIRDSMKFPPGEPVVGDKIICIRNHPGTGAVNGQQATVLNIEPVGRAGRAYKIEADSYGEKVEWKVDSRGFTGQPGQEAVKGDRSTNYVAATFGWAITCHSAQGSEWNSVAVVDESFVFREDSSRWLYTAATRAERKCLLLDKRNMV